jgi:hypothetical protein
VISKNPPPPEIGDVFEGPPIGMPFKRGLYYVRAIVDVEPEEDPDYGWIYQVVFRFYSKRKGWRYEIRDSFAIGMGLYKKINKRKSARRAS